MNPVLDFFIVGSAAMVAVFVYVFGSFIWGAGYQPTPKSSLEQIPKYIDLRGKRFYDLGAGYGRVMKFALSNGADPVVGVEIDPVKVFWLRRHVKAPGAVVMKENIFNMSFKDADVVFAFLWPGFMAKIEARVSAEMPKGSYFVSYDHTFPNLKPAIEDKKYNIHIYKF
jgi:ribosomal protein L11 methylase PrmA